MWPFRSKPRRLSKWEQLTALTVGQLHKVIDGMPDDMIVVKRGCLGGYHTVKLAHRLCVPIDPGFDADVWLESVVIFV